VCRNLISWVNRKCVAARIVLLSLRLLPLISMDMYVGVSCFVLQALLNQMAAVALCSLRFRVLYLKISYACLASFTSLDRSKRRWKASLSGPTKRCSRRCTSGCALKQNIFFRGIHALPKRWNTFMERNGDHIEKRIIVYLVSSINYEIKNIEDFHLTHPRTTTSFIRTGHFLTVTNDLVQPLPLCGLVISSV